MKRTQLFLRKHSSTILTVVGSAGVIVTSVLAVKATPKALKLIEEEKQSRTTAKTIYADNEKYLIPYYPELTKLEIVKVAWKPYIPAVISGVSTIACIFGANMLNRRNQAALMSAYALLDNTYREYREKTKELYPEENSNIEHEIIKSKFDQDMDIDLDDGKEQFFDFQSMRWFRSTREEVEQAAELLNKKLAMDGHACLNDFYDILGVGHTPYGYQLGWSIMYNDKMYGKPELDFNYEKHELDDGMEYTIITIDYPPSLEYFC